MDMKRLTLAAVAAVAAVAALAGAAHAQSFDPRAYQDDVRGERTQVLVLGTMHLSGAPETFDAAVLEPLLQRLARFAPDAIAIEGLSGESLDALWRYRDIYPEVADDYGRRVFVLAALGRAGTGLEMPRAEAEARRLLAEWPDEPTPAQRRRLAAMFASAGDPNSALVQWYRLDRSERRPADGITQALANELDGYERRRNENHLIGARLAARLGHERVFPTDDHAADDVVIARMADLEAFYAEPWVAEIMQDPDMRRFAESAQALRNPREALETYRMLNAPESGQRDSDLQWLSVLNRASPNNVGRVRIAEWEARNLRMAAHIREVTGLAPGGRVLVIVGSAHKAWLDAYLGMMSDIEIVDATAVLR
jgi:hypothetical protein